MKIYELTNKGYESVDEDIPKINFTQENCFWSTSNDIPCGTLFVHVPVGEDYDIITYIVRFNEEEFEKIKKIYLTKFPE